MKTIFAVLKHPPEKLLLEENGDRLLLCISESEAAAVDAARSLGEGTFYICELRACIVLTGEKKLQHSTHRLPAEPTRSPTQCVHGVERGKGCYACCDPSKSP